LLSLCENEWVLGNGACENKKENKGKKMLHAVSVYKWF
jgi:hypothetical protein